MNMVLMNNSALQLVQIGPNTYEIRVYGSTIQTVTGSNQVACMAYEAAKKIYK